jgi:acyl-CoA synthetase (AMP-forming)/AMP-acid ligase II
MATTAGQWNFADVWEAVADRFGDEPALLHGDEERTWSQFDRRADGLAATLLDAGLDRQAAVAQYQRNGPAYLETLFATFKASLVPVNTNYRYGADELVQLWGDAEAAAVVFDADFAALCDQVRPRVPHVRRWICVGERHACPGWAEPYDDAAEAAPDRVVPPGGRSGDDLFLLYTGGTTGLPKGVMWRQDDLFAMLEGVNGRRLADEADARAYVGALDRPGPRVLPAAPLMHGTAAWFSMPALNRAGSVVTLTAPSFDPVELLDAVTRLGVKGISIVGDAFARPLLRHLDTAPDRWDLSSLRVIGSSGAMLSRESKERLLVHAPRAKVVDSLGSSESGMSARSVAGGDGVAGTARFELGPGARVVDDEGHDVTPGSGVRGRVAIAGRIPLGYRNDPAKTAETFVEIDGRRHVVPGDWAMVEADGTVLLLGRGSVCINTGGEKVFPEEVEEVLKTWPGVHDAAVVGVPDERFGEAVVALVEPEPDHAPDEADLIGHVKAHLAGYKAPKRVLAVDSLGRAVNGKLDYTALRARAVAATTR